ncbi:pleckstrin domain-containing protein [Trypanosoma rangeli]|uniref:Pleckstrin domain-containing protein n=1 Tax=Trypanosoma rangeli TaxID=5698 RepID=A0A422NCI4_TRYRA|nr:pleckstrin domain-containing protein [Trypanosoma rangeli]RNF03019.1 pleckstrin domain-containing protein [Trypanosoma rangeli]|eukprot:RNF03019.1 pleckstrin domain-containing protein [Trypanosoma rangeli]
MGSSFSAELSDTRELASVFLDTFGREYEKLYMWFMVQRVRKAMQHESETSNGNTVAWRLYRAPEIPTQVNDRDQFMAAKLSKHWKHWKPRFFVLRGDFLLDYYESRNDYLEGRHSLGTINLGSVVVSCNATQATEERLDRLAAAFSVARSEVPPPETYPELTVELYHPRRATIYLQFPVRDRYDVWCGFFQQIHWLTERVTTKDRHHQRAFIEALRRARVMCGLPDSLEFSGLEAVILQDAINELVDTQVVPKLLLTMSGSSWKNRMSQLNLFIEASDELLRKFVWGKWHAMQGKTCVHRVMVEARVRDNMEKLNAFEEPLREEVHNYMSGETKLFLEAQVEEPLRKLATKVVSPLCAVYATLPRIYEACVSQGKVHYEPRGDRMFLASQYNCIGECYEAERRLWQLHEPIASMKGVFNGLVYEWRVIQDAAVMPLRRIIANGIFTFETLFERDKIRRPWDAVLREVGGFLEDDAHTMARDSLIALLYETAVNFFRDEHVKPSLKRLKATMIAPLESRVPDDLRPFILGVQEVVADVLEGDLRDMCRDIAEYAIRRAA